MRLTLRTLLAYLDNTLEPEDAEALRLKLADSGFATQLVQRIRSTLVSPHLSAPSPAAVNPSEEANAISEYLDSTLSPEQVAEIERACLESDTHLAEAAACHQILTMVLGTKANVPDSLRERIYALPDRKVEEIAASGSFAAVSVPDSGTLTGIPTDVPPVQPVLRSPSEKIPPVGVGDSGVMNAPARLRDSEELDGPAIAGSNPRRVDRSDLYGGQVRSSRITPWLVSLALAGVLLFVLAKIFKPLMTGDTVAMKPDPVPTFPVPESDEPEPISASEMDASSAESPELETVPPPPPEPDSSIGSPENPGGTDSDETALPAPMDTDASAKSNANSGDKPSAKNADSVEEIPAPVASAVNTKPIDESGTQPTTEDTAVAALKGDSLNQDMSDDAATPTVAAVLPTAASDAASPSSDDKMTADPPTKDQLTDDVTMKDPDAADDASKMSEDPDDPAEVDPIADDPNKIDTTKQIGLAKVLSDRSLLLASGDGKWLAVKKDMVISQAASLINAPKFRSRLALNDAATITLVNATSARFTPPADATEAPGLSIGYGRALIQSNEPDLSMALSIGGYDLTLGMPEKDSVAAVEVVYLRRPGFDPFKPESHTPMARVISVDGVVNISASTGDESLEAAKTWWVRGNEPPKVTDLPEIPEWLDPANNSESLLDESARKGLLLILEQDQPVEASLREATQFRKAEVAALAAQVMLHTGNSDVYFGTDGILSQSKQRAFFSDHFRALRSVVNRDTDASKQLYDEIAKMDSANSKSMFRLLTGFSQNQLVEGADEDLIEMLDSNSMSVRIMAAENLREITGTTMNYRPEEANAVRRVPVIKKWQVRQRKGTIRWPADK